MIFISKNLQSLKKNKKGGSALEICLRFLAGFLPKLARQNPKHRDYPAKIGTNTQPTMPCRACKGPVRGPYLFGRRRCSGSAWANRTGLMWLSVFSRNLKVKNANNFTFFNYFKKGTIGINT